MKILEQTKRKPKTSPSDEGKSKRKPKESLSDNGKTKRRSKESPSGGNIPKPQVQPTDDGLPKPSTNKSITIRLLYRNGTDVEDDNFILAVQNALNKGGDDYSSNNIFK